MASAPVPVPRSSRRVPGRISSATVSRTPSAAAQLRRAGFRRVETAEETLEHAFHPPTYIDFLEQYAEEETFLSLEPELAGRLREGTLERLAKLEPASFVWRVPVVSGVARRGRDRS